MVRFYLQFFKKVLGIIGKVVAHLCVPFCTGAPLAFLVHPNVHHAHRLKSTVLETLKTSGPLLCIKVFCPHIKSIENKQKPQRKLEEFFFRIRLKSKKEIFTAI